MHPFSRRLAIIAHGRTHTCHVLNQCVACTFHCIRRIANQWENTAFPAFDCRVNWWNERPGHVVVNRGEQGGIPSPRFCFFWCHDCYSNCYHYVKLLPTMRKFEDCENVVTHYSPLRSRSIETFRVKSKSVYCTSINSIRLRWSEP